MVATVAAAAIMLTLAVPMLGLRLGSSDAGNDPAGQTTRKAYDLIAQGFGKGFNGPLQVAVKLPQANAAASLTQLNAGLRAAPDVASVAVPRIDAAGTTAAIQVFPRSSPQSAQTTNLVTHLRNSVLPPIERATGTTVYIGGATASQVDFANVLSSKLPLFIGIVIALSALLLMIVFRSFVIPLQAAVMNVLSIGAALGIVQAVFERGWVFGIQPGPIDAFIPVMGFAIIFGLSMDYEVFLISRVHEEWQRTGDATSAIREGLGHTGRVITAAATVMVAVFGAFAISGNRTLELFGVMMASAVFLDAVVIRMIMLPAVLQLLGRRTWEFPRGLDRRLPRLAIEPPPEPNGPRAPRSKKPHDDLRRTVRPGARADHSPPPSARVRAAPARAGRRSARRARRPPRANPSAPDRSDPALVAGGSRRLWNAMIRVAFLDDHTAVRAGVQAILASPSQP
jgi:RND superfamily putative drug exporter